MVGDQRYGWLGMTMLPIKAIDTLQPLYGLTVFILLLYYLANGSLCVLAPVGAVIGGKIVIDLLFHLWSVHFYRRWAQIEGGSELQAVQHVSFALALLAALAEPFTFQILRHTGAAWGWLFFLTGPTAGAKKAGAA